jgi:trehalose 6-phosphate phosphatase
VPYVFDYLDVIREALRRSSFGLITDVDGTISQTAPTPQQAKVTPLCRRYLSALCNQLALVAAISGRPAAEVKSMINIDGMIYIGNHGLERWIGGHSEFVKDARAYPPVIEAVTKELSPLLSIEGISIENKGVTATIQYRLCPNHQLAKRDILAAIENSPHARSLRIMQESKYAINLLPPVKVDKGTATLNLIQEYNLQGGVYLGDDITDIDAFSAIHAACRDLDFHGFAIGISSQEMPEKLADEAGFTLNGVDDVERFLKWLSQTANELS